MNGTCTNHCGIQTVCSTFDMISWNTIGNLHYRRIFDLGKSTPKKQNPRKEPFKSSKIPKFRLETLRNTENIALRSLQIFYVFLLRVEIVAIFKPKIVIISASNTIIWKICKLCTAIFSTHYNIFQPNLGMLSLLKGSFREFVFFDQIKN